MALYKLIAQKLSTDLNAFEKSVEYYIQFKEQIKAQADAEKKKQVATKEPTLEEKMSKSWDKFDKKNFGRLNVSEKEALARELAAEQRNIQLEHMATHPGETAKEMIEGAVRVDKTS